jgi:hypothetical protein
VILIIPIMIYRQRRERDMVFWGAVFALLAVGFGAVAWGLGIARYNTFHAFYGAISTIAIPVATVAAVAALRAVRRSRWRWLGPALVIVLVIQLQVGAFATMLRLEELGPNRYPPVPLAVLDAIRALPANAKLAYSCQPMEEITGVWDPMLAGITAHTGRVLVPMCFTADTEAPAMGGVLDRDAPSPDFAFARQRMLFPNASSRPSSEEVAAFLKAHGVHYVYEDDLHPNELVAAANVVIDMSGHQVLTIR